MKEGREGEREGGREGERERERGSEGGRGKKCGGVGGWRGRERPGLLYKTRAGARGPFLRGC